MNTLNEIYKAKATRLVNLGVLAYRDLQRPYSMAAILEGKDNLHVGPENEDHNYYMILDAAYDLHKGRR